jgi:hypothetical protein
MEITEVFTGMAIVLIGIIAIFGVAANFNTTYGSSIGSEGEFSETITRVEAIIGTGLVDEGLEYADSTQVIPGAGESTNQNDNLIRRALSTISLLPQLVGLAPALIKEGAVALNLPDIYWRLGQALFWIVFSITLAYLLLIGARRLLG